VVGVQRIDFQLLLDLRAALLGRNHAVADRRQRAVPEALPGILLQGPENMLGVFLGLVLVEQRHDLAHHDVHRVVAHLLGDGDELHAVLGERPHIELKLEMIAEEMREAVNHDHVEGCGFCRPGFDHALKLGTAIIRGGRARLDVSLDELVAPRNAISFTLPALIGDGDIMLGLPRRRDAQVEGGAPLNTVLGRGHDGNLLTSSAWPE
jgi:hypothetical protein